MYFQVFRQFIFILLILFSAYAGAMVELVQTPDKVVMSIDRPDRWKAVPGLLGFSVVIFSPESKDKVTVGISVTQIPMNGFDSGSMNEELAKYLQEKKTWLAKKNNSGDFQILGKEFSQSKGNLHFLKASYVLEGEKFLEKNYFVGCLGKLAQIKAMVPLKNRDIPATEKIIDQIAKGFSCTAK